MLFITIKTWVPLSGLTNKLRAKSVLVGKHSTWTDLHSQACRTLWSNCRPVDRIFKACKLSKYWLLCVCYNRQL